MTGTALQMAVLALLLVLAVLVGGQGGQGEECQRQPYRPQYHYSARRNWLNDPNGLVLFEGEWHLFYQYNPTNPLPGNVSWGHAVSSDLVHWRELEVAIRFTEEEQVFSGSAVIDHNNTAGFGSQAMVAIYTSARSDGIQAQSLAYSTDRGRTFTRYSGNPVLNINQTQWRDPKVQWYQPAGASSGYWLMAVSLADAHRIQFYSSPDLKSWTHLSDFGPAGGTGGQWECPDLFELPVEGGQGSRWVLFVSLNPGGLQGGSGMQYFLGNFNGTHFTEEEEDDDSIRWLDFGKDFYAAVTWNNSPRRIMIGWMSNWQYAAETPTSPWRNAMSVPRELSLVQRDGKVVLAQTPVSTLGSLRRGGPSCVSRRRVTNSSVTASSRINGDLFVLDVDVTSRGARRFGVRVRAGSGQRTEVGYDAQVQQLYVNRTMSGRVNFSDDFPGVHSAPLQLRNQQLQMQILVDSGSVEVLAENGTVAITDIIFPDDSSRGVELFAEGGAAEFSLVRLYRLGSYRNCPDQSTLGLAGLNPFSLDNIFGNGCPRS